MKLRMKGDSFRLRLTRSELSRLLQGERIEESVHFGAEPMHCWIYALQVVQQQEAISVNLENNRVTVNLSARSAETWQDEREVGVYSEVPTGAGKTLEVTVEKDFACLDRSDAENSDTFANPAAGTKC
jgi:hypothetical protein